MWYNQIIKWLLNSPLHFFVSGNMMLITYRGRKSGSMYTTPVNYFPAQDEQGEYLATTSFAERTWWRNLRGGAAVTVRVKGQDLQAEALAIEDEEQVAQGIYEFLSATPELAKYYQVGLDDNGLPDQGDIDSYSPGKVLLKVRLA